MQIKKYTQVNIAVAIILSLFITSCNSDAPVMERPEKVYYDTAQRRMKANNFFSAIESLEAIEARYPFGRYAEQAQSELIYAYFTVSYTHLRAHELRRISYAVFCLKKKKIIFCYFYLVNSLHLQTDTRQISPCLIC